MSSAEEIFKEVCNIAKAEELMTARVRKVADQTRARQTKAQELCKRTFDARLQKQWNYIEDGDYFYLCFMRHV